MPLTITLADDPQDANTLYVGTWYDGVYLSQDGGNSFEAINTRLPSSYSLTLALAVDPVDPDRIYLSAGSSVYFFKDKGSQLNKLAGDPSPDN